MTTISGYLVAEEADWQIPAYAQNMLWMQQDAHAAQTHGPRGAFTLDVPGEGVAAMQLVWGAAGGPPLTVWHRPEIEAPFVVGWQGTVKIGGFVERLHALTVRGLALVVAEVEGSLLPAHYRRLPTLVQMQSVPFIRQDADAQPLTRDHVYTFIAGTDTIQAEYLHHAMISELALDCYATLAPQKGQWYEVVGLPLLLEAVTLLAPGVTR
jgi:hypothetical protein